MSVSCVAWPLLAQAAAPAAEPAAPSPLGALGMFLPIILVVVLYWVMMVLPERRKQAQKLSSLKKNDRVVTIGGIYGVVTNVQRESDRVTIRVDETTSSKIDVTLGAISRILVDDATADKTTKT